MTGRVWALAVGAAIVLAACSDSPTGGGNPAANEVWMQSSTFAPAARTVTSGTAVTWTNKESGIQHNVTSSAVPGGAAAFSSANLNVNQTFQVTLTVAGTYNYYCTLHGTPATGMRGTVTVN